MVLLCKDLIYASSNSDLSALQLKRFNTIFKILDQSLYDWLIVGTPIRNTLDDLWQDLLYRLPASGLVTQITYPLPVSCPDANTRLELANCKEIPLTVLFNEGPIARAYLETIRSLGLKPKSS